MMDGALAVDVTDRCPPPTAEDVAAAERALGVSLPGELVELLREYNGGWLEEAVVDGADVLPMHFFAIGACEGHNDLLKTAHLLRDALPQGVIPLVELEGGDKICIRAGAEPAPILLWSHEAGGTDPEDALEPLAESLDAFLARLRPDEDT